MHTHRWGWWLGIAMAGGWAGPSMAEPVLLATRALNEAPTVVAGVDHRLLLGPGDEIEVAGPFTEHWLPGQRHRLVRARHDQRAAADAGHGPVWVQAVGWARVLRTEERTHASKTRTNGSAWMRIEAASDAVQLGDRVTPAPENGGAP